MAESSQSEKSIFLEALRRNTPEERAAYLDEACGADPRLRREVEALLNAHHPEDSFLEKGPVEEAKTLDMASLSEGVGTVIGGRYKLLEQIGEGGMGVVYMAEQIEPVRRKVALKIIKPGMDSKQVVARFEAERQALALMNHQNIALVLDAGGTESGRPYFVMELVKGVPITEYCDHNRLPLRERLDLFIPVCHAIQHAHQKGIIHRDIKPSNVLMCLYDGRPVPKVIDFGVAKAIQQPLVQQTLFTQFGQVVGTLEYMSPEQAELNQLDVDTRSDVYSLGVLLYELLTGTTPITHDELARTGFPGTLLMICEQEAETPSLRLAHSTDTLPEISAQRRVEPQKLPGLVRGEPDWIVMKALEKDRTRRYATAADLARDVQRHLDDEPVEACPPSAAYKLRKWSRKHRVALTVAASFVLLLLAGAAVSTAQAIRATRAEKQATAERDHAVAAEQQATAERDQAEAARREAEAARQQVRRALYAADINIAQKAWETRQIPRLRQLLEQQVPRPGETDLRTFEWRYLWRLANSERLTLTEDSGQILDIAMAADANSLAAALSNGQVAVWDLRTGTRRWAKKADATSVWTVAYSPDGSSLVTGGPEKRVRIWDAASGDLRQTWDACRENVTAVAFTPGGDAVAVGHLAGHALELREFPSGELIRSFAGLGGDQRSLSFSADGKLLAAGGPFEGAGMALVWDVESGQIKVAPQPTIPSRFQHPANKRPPLPPGVVLGAVSSVALAPDGSRLAVALGHNPVTGTAQSTAIIYETSQGKELRKLEGHRAAITSVAFTPDGATLLTGSMDGTARLWNVETGEQVRALLGHTAPVYSVSVSKDGQTLITGSADKTVKLWDAKVDDSLGLKSDSPRRISLAPQGHLFATCSRKSVTLWNADTREQRHVWSTAASTVAFSPDSANVIGGGSDGQITVWKIATGKQVEKWPTKLKTIRALAVHPQGGWLAITSGYVMGGRVTPDNAKVQICDMKERRCVSVLPDHPNAVTSLQFSPDGRFLVTTCGEPTYQFNRSADVRVWEVGTWALHKTLKCPIAPMCIAFSPDGTTLAVGTANGRNPAQPGEVVIWEFPNGIERGRLEGFKGPVWALAFSPDGKSLATGEGDGTVKLWDIAAQRERLQLSAHSLPVVSLGFTGDSSCLVTLGYALEKSMFSQRKPAELKLWSAAPKRDARD